MNTNDKANTTPTSLVGHGPSKAAIGEYRGQKVVIKQFPEAEHERVILESHKLQTMREMGAASGGLFKVPKVLDITPTSYTMEFIPNCADLNGALCVLPLQDVVAKLVQIVNFFAVCPSYNVNPVWDVMLEKFKAVRTDNERYNQAVQRLPATMNLHAGYSHGDLCFDNILVDANKVWYLIDPAWSKAESPFWDVGKILQSTAANWECIKNTGAVGPRSAPLIQINEGLLAEFSAQGMPAHVMLLSYACQLSRVARWCFADVLVPMVVKLLETYLNESEDRCLDALRRPL